MSQCVLPKQVSRPKSPLLATVYSSITLGRGLGTLATFSFPRLMKFIYFLSLMSLLPECHISTEEIAMGVSLPLLLRVILPCLSCSLSLRWATQMSSMAQCWACMPSNHHKLPEASNGYKSVARHPLQRRCLLPRPITATNNSNL